MAYGGLGSAGQQFEQLPLIGGFDGEDVDERDNFGVRRDRCHRRIPTACLEVDAIAFIDNAT